MNDRTDSPVAFFTSDHRRCDQLWADLEAEIERGGPGVSDVRKQFDAAMRRHLSMEEEVFFPAFEQATGMHGGPTTVMRMEHVQMRGVLDQMAECDAEGDYEGVLDQGDTLNLLIQQHNAKEEGMLYPMASRVLSARWPDIRAALARFE